MEITRNRSFRQNKVGSLSPAKAVVVSAFALIIGISACSSDSPNQSTFTDGMVSTDLYEYLPVNTSYQISYSIRDSLGQELRVEHYYASSETYVNGRSGVVWSGFDQSDSSSIFNGAIFWDNDAIYHLSDGAERAEVLLQKPIEVSASWDRWYTSNSENLLDTLSYGDLDDPNVNDPNDPNSADFDDEPGDDPSTSSFPTEGSSKFYIASVDSDVFSGGQFYENCLEVVNAGYSQTVNRYWYAPGVGLVKFALYCEFGSAVGSENGEIINN